jgi:hypothetical protein
MMTNSNSTTAGLLSKTKRERVHHEPLLIWMRQHFGNSMPRNRLYQMDGFTVQRGPWYELSVHKTVHKCLVISWFLRTARLVID